jgi:hypothetical protein
MRFTLGKRQGKSSFRRAAKSAKRNPAAGQGLKLVAGVGFEPTAFRL